MRTLVPSRGLLLPRLDRLGRAHDRAVARLELEPSLAVDRDDDGGRGDAVGAEIGVVALQREHERADDEPEHDQRRATHRRTSARPCG